jgi:hypothetical protein
MVRSGQKRLVLTPIFEVRIVIYDHNRVWHEGFQDFWLSLSFLRSRRTVLTFSPSRALLAAMARRGGTTPDPRPRSARLQQL